MNIEQMETIDRTFREIKDERRKIFNDKTQRQCGLQPSEGTG